MSKKTSSEQATFGPLQKKTFRSSLVRELKELVPSLGELTANAIAEHIQKFVDEFFPSTSHLRMGQMMWPAVCADESGGWGKRIEDTKIKPVLLEAINDSDIQDFLDKVKKKEVRKKVAVRLFDQAYEQGGVLTGVDVAVILGVTPATISRYVREHEKATGKLVPRRGTVHDMGRSVSHKKEICKRVIIEGESIELTARDTNHSVEAVTRYVNDYRRVYTCLKNGFTISQTAYATKMSKKLVVEYQDIMKSSTLQNQEDDVIQ